MEPEHTTRRQLRTLDQYVLSCVRTIWGRDNSREVPTVMADGTTQVVRQQRSNLEVRTMFRLPTFSRNYAIGNSLVTGYACLSRR